MSQRDPIVAIARQLIRATGGQPAVDDFDDALEDYGLRRAVEETAVGIGMGLIMQRARQQQANRVQAPSGPYVEERDLPERDGVRLLVDTQADDVDARPPRAHEDESAVPGAVMIDTPSGTWMWDVGFDYARLDPEDPRNGILEVDVLEAEQDIEIVAVDEAEGDEEGEPA